MTFEELDNQLPNGFHDAQLPILIPGVRSRRFGP